MTSSILAQNQRHVKVDVQGQVFKVSLVGFRGRRGVAPRGVVQGFSRKSRKRLIEKLARLDLQGALPLFVTLTYPQEYPDARRAKDNLRAYLQRLQRLYPGMSVVWRLEFQERGAPHFHLLIFGVPRIPKEEVQRHWGEVIGYANPFTRVERVRTWRGVVGYAAKYMAKAGLDIVPYLHACGRVWGVFMARFLPSAPLGEFFGEFGPWVYQVRRCLRRVWRGVVQGRHAGYTLFTAKPVDWLGLACFFGFSPLRGF
jgi:hypothetical protein